MSTIKPYPADRLILIAGVTNTKNAGRCIEATFTELGQAQVQGFGANSVNQAAKAVAVACMKLNKKGTPVVSTIEFVMTTAKGREMCALLFTVRPDQAVAA